MITQHFPEFTLKFDINTRALYWNGHFMPCSVEEAAELPETGYDNNILLGKFSRAIVDIFPLIEEVDHE